MNQVIGDKNEFSERLIANIEKVIEKQEFEFTIEDIDSRLRELQQEIMSLVRLNVKTGPDTRDYDKEYSALASEIELLREWRQRLKDAEAEQVLRVKRIKEIKDYLAMQKSPLEKFDGDLFRKLIEKVKIDSMIEVVFVLRQRLR